MSKKNVPDRDLEDVSGGAVDLAQNTGTTADLGTHTTQPPSSGSGGGSGIYDELEENDDPNRPISGAV